MDIYRVIRIGNILTNLIDSSTGESVNYKLVTTYFDNTPMDDTKADGVLYVKKDSEYFIRIYSDWGKSYLDKDTITEFRNITSTELLLLRSGRYKGVRINGISIKSNIITSINYYISNTSQPDNNKDVIIINTIKFKCPDYFEYTRADFLTKISSNLLTPNKHYKISDSIGGGLLVIALTTNTIAKDVIMFDDNFDNMHYDISTNIIECYDYLGAMIKNIDGVWTIIDNGDHTPKKISGISTPSTEYFNIIYLRDDYNEIVNFMITPDETYQSKNIRFGVSAGVMNSAIYFSISDAYAYLSYNGTILSVSSNDFTSGINGVNFNNSTGAITIDHNSMKSYGVNAISGNILHRVIIDAVNELSTVLKVVDNDGEVILSPVDIKIFFSKLGPRNLSNTNMNITDSNIYVNGIMKKVYKPI